MPAPGTCRASPAGWPRSPACSLLERIPRVPGALVVIVASIAASGCLAAHGVALTGPIHLTLAAPAFVLPPGARWLPLTEFSLALMFILFAESYGSIRTFALKHDEAVQPNRDLLALGVANLVSGVLQGTPVGAGYSGTAANEAAGARSRLRRPGRRRRGAAHGGAVPALDRAHPGAGAGGDRHPRGQQVAAPRRVRQLPALAARPADRVRRGAGGGAVRGAERPADRHRLQPRHADPLAGEPARVGARAGRRARLREPRALPQRRHGTRHAGGAPRAAAVLRQRRPGADAGALRGCWRSRRRGSWC